MDPAPGTDARAALHAHVERLLARLPDGLAERGGEPLRRVAVASDFALEVFTRQPHVLEALIDDPSLPMPPPRLDPATPDAWPAQLRAWRTAVSAGLVWRDVNGLDDVGDTLSGSTRLAEECLRLGLDALEGQFAARHGVVRDRDGAPVRLVVFALGKLGGGELNFSSDVDLVYAYAETGESDGPRPLAADEYFARLGRALAKLLDEPTVDGFCHRVDLRLRPFGNAGRVALSFAAMEQYFQREGRDWERYAWQKARPVAGDLDAGERFLVALRPFIYRRYFDYGALAGLREMKSAIEAEVARKDLADDVKRGSGGIREIEFLVQVLQLIRGGREAALRGRRLLPMLDALRAARQVEAEAARDLAEAYLFLRRVENRLQMLRDAQTHVLPDDPVDRLRIADGLARPDWAALVADITRRRTLVAAEFDALLSHRDESRAAVSGDLAGYWRALPEGGDARVLAAAGFGDPGEVDAALRDFARSPSVRELSDAVRARLDRVMPVMLQASAPADRPLQAMRRLLALLHNILRRASYLALLDEQPAALARLTDLVTRSAFLAERVAAHPLLLDELLDARVEGPMPGREQIDAACAAALRRDDLEAALFTLNETRQALSFRIALATLDGRMPAVESVRQLAWLADGVVAAVLELAQREMRVAHGTVPDAPFAAIGYGSLGGEELGVGSDLDLVFLYDAPADAQSDGRRPLEAQRWFARLAQKIVLLLGTPTGAGQLYEVDVRLRPDGGSGLLVSSLAAYDGYQRERAWTWEHQALVRARCVAGDETLQLAFERVREAALGRTRDPATLAADVSGMRARMRGELDRGRDGLFDLKQGEGGLVDLEFLLQALVLGGAASHPELLGPRSTPALIGACRDAGLFDAATAAAVTDAHAQLVAQGLAQTLDRRARIVPHSEALDAARAAITAVLHAAGLAPPHLP
ncbi:bifunctional [glutamate--ammonia ligase]-adenylyl-L-tyrosine phosphorylase/[glutamate--ammonia-ligase] adenylyltransferase [Luteimonas terricola]|uniref:Bifunctional glutamine synthetase adenylyltransferase/adenylyl-removing enzyme n=1 Tax=Luteimonas terricola TaxID=645597 RepID=A0ABQ2ELH7_9GAMM|nr:bifunctional [glutamate--ammonia ligase]-adenylyl-L-tyrosine phosphorylase/[glutamate--ammonia-ligase] adenylyltransferase [Luteimonas terricola]GGK13669.1 glutamate-ammonia-ligase adenylyltransferase [Luteimonas terricola]